MLGGRFGWLAGAFCATISSLTYAGDVSPSAFLYQGQLKQSGAPADGLFDFQFTLLEVDGVTQVGRTCAFDVEVVNGLFQALVDFGPTAFDGSARLLQVGVRPALGGIPDCTPNTFGFFEILSPLQTVRPVPYAMRTLDGPDGHSLDAVDGDPVDALYVGANGAVGIGTTTPGAKVEVNGASSAVRVANTGGFDGPALQLVNPNAAIVTDNVGTLSFSRGGFSADGSSRAEVLFGNTVNESLRFQFVSVNGATSTIERMRILESGEVGIGTSNPQARLHVAAEASGTGVILPGLRVLQNTTSPNVIGGFSGNSVESGVFGATIGGGGSARFSGRHNRVTDDFGTVGGGEGNQAGDGGAFTQSAHLATVCGGFENTASGEQSAVGGGFENTAQGRSATVGGGDTNVASGSFSTVGGGFVNSAPGDSATVPGGDQNVAGGDFSFAAGRRAKVRDTSETGDNDGDEGTFVWADSTFADFTSTGPNQFLIRAGGGVGINKTNPVAGALDVSGSGLFSGNVGVGTTAPARRLHVSNGSSGGASFSNAELLVEDNSSCYISLMSPDASERGLAFGSPASNVHGGIYYSNASGLSLRTGGNDTRMVIEDQGNVGIATAGNSVDARLHVQSDGARVAKFDRYTSDGELVAFARDDLLVGTITNNGGTVSYNAFTGSHYAWSAAPIAVGALVSMTGENRRYGDRADFEVVYGIEETARANDPACLGVYIGKVDAANAAGPENPLLVASVGNGEMCIVDRGSGDIEPGDYLISSDVLGCAMRDDPVRFAIGHVVARAAERMRWGDVRADSRSTKRRTISVLFGSFVRHSATEEWNQRLRDQQIEMDELESRLARLESVRSSSGH